MADDQRDDTIDDEVRKHYEIINAPNYYSHGKALAAARAHRAAVVKSSPEVAALRARVAELEAGAYALGRIETLRRCGSEITVDADVPLSDLEVNHALDVQLARQWLAEADRLEAEHGYAPDEARIRADERAKCEADVERLRAALAHVYECTRAALATAAAPEPKSLYRSNCPKKGHCVQGCLRTEPCRAEQAAPAACTHPKDRRIATYDEPGAFTCVACGFAVDTYSPEHAATPVAQHDKPRDLHLSTYDWTAACGDGGREVWHIDAGNEWDTREDAEAAIARHEARIRADERAKCEAEIASLRAVLSTLVDAVYRVCDWSEGSRVGDALAEAEALLEAEAAAALEATDG